MDIDTVRNAPAFPFNTEQGITMHDITTIASMMALVSSGVTENVGATAVSIANDVTEAIAFDQSGDEEDE